VAVISADLFFAQRARVSSERFKIRRVLNVVRFLWTTLY